MRKHFTTFRNNVLVLETVQSKNETLAGVPHPRPELREFRRTSVLDAYACAYLCVAENYSRFISLKL